MANAIINYFEQLGIILDCGGSEYKNSEAIVSFQCDRNNRIVLAEELNEHSEKLQQIISSLNAPLFKFDIETGLMLCYVQLSCKSFILNHQRTQC
ncbi:MAG: hypothetical protein NHB32_21305 [Fischerella sp. CENA71]|nr:hypothetical protein [Fischerella sp. CENA71]